MKEYPVLIDPEAGKTYLNHNGSTYLCTRRIDAETAVMVRQSDGWTLVAHRTRQFEDGTIEWDHSTDGHWPGGHPITMKGGQPHGHQENPPGRPPGQSGG